MDNGPAPRKDENRPQFFDSLDQYRALSANSGDAFRQNSAFNRPPIDNYIPLAPLVDNFKPLDNFRSPSYNAGKK